MKYLVPLLVVLACSAATPFLDGLPFLSQVVCEPKPGVTLANFQRIRYGTSLECVEKLMGQRVETHTRWTGAACYHYEGKFTTVDLVVGGEGVREGSFNIQDGPGLPWSSLHLPPRGIYIPDPNYMPKWMLNIPVSDDQQ